MDMIVMNVKFNHFTLQLFRKSTNASSYLFLQLDLLKFATDILAPILCDTGNVIGHVITF